MKKNKLIKKIIIFLVVINMFMIPTFALNNEAIEIQDRVVELEWGNEAIDAFRTFDLTVKADESLSFESSNEAVVIVDEKGSLLSRGYGQATITVRGNSTGNFDQINVRVFLVGDEETPLSPVTFIQPYVLGYENGSFKALLDITGYEVSVMLARALNLPLIEDKDSSWFDSSINALKENEIISENSKYASDEFITRLDFAVILAATLKQEKRSMLLDGFPMVYDLDESSTDKTAVYTLLEFEIMFLDEESLFKPSTFVSRGEAVRTINRLIGREPYLLGESDFEDIDKDDTFFGDIDAASSFYNLKYDN